MKKKATYQNSRAAQEMEHIALLCQSYVRKQKAVVVFCPSKDQCEKVAISLSQGMPMQFKLYSERDRAKATDFSSLEEELNHLVYDYLDEYGVYSPWRKYQIFDKEL